MDSASEELGRLNHVRRSFDQARVCVRTVRFLAPCRIIKKRTKVTFEDTEIPNYNNQLIKSFVFISVPLGGEFNMENLNLKDVYK